MIVRQTAIYYPPESGSARSHFFIAAAAGKVIQMSNTKVKCKVSECVHFADELCTADTIKVTSQNGILSDCTCCAETECSTFKKK